ncbi:MAG TPA: hypothetical protein VLW84_05235 [Terriglobales bacterium]|nr:hypothetical protein [Terriglobales bacterium]
MKAWKRAVVAGSATASAILFLRKKRAAGVLFAGVSLATLAWEYPEEFARIRRDLPDYLEKGTKLLVLASYIGERLAAASEGSEGPELLRG